MTRERRLLLLVLLDLGLVVAGVLLPWHSYTTRMNAVATRRVLSGFDEAAAAFSADESGSFNGLEVHYRGGWVLALSAVAALLLVVPTATGRRAWPSFVACLFLAAAALVVVLDMTSGKEPNRGIDGAGLIWQRAAAETLWLPGEPVGGYAWWRADGRRMAAASRHIRWPSSGEVLGTVDTERAFGTIVALAGTVLAAALSLLRAGALGKGEGPRPRRVRPSSRRGPATLSGPQEQR